MIGARDEWISSGGAVKKYKFSKSWSLSSHPRWDRDFVPRALSSHSIFRRAATRISNTNVSGKVLPDHEPLIGR